MFLKEGLEKCKLDNEISYQEHIMQGFRSKAMHEFNDKLQQYLVKNLSELGYLFETEEQFFTFCKDRITRTTFEHRPNYYEMFIDYKDKQNTGTFIGSYSDDVSIEFEGNKVTAYIGRTTGKQ